MLVIEEKRPFIELHVRDALYRLADRPVVVGKTDEADQPLVPGYGILDADLIEKVLRSRLAPRLGEDALAPARPERQLIPVSGTALPGRTPYFCSGCPHNRSTKVPEGSVAGGGIGCHGMALLLPDGRVEGITQMGGEGAQWVGASMFVDTPHRFQNLGDGTLFHSGSLAIRQAVSAGTNVTYKILYNGVVAMTGGQQAAGELTVPDLTRLLEAEGVVRTLVVTDDTSRYDAVAELAPNADVWDRSRLDEGQRLLREIPGVTALIYDQGCAAELRRARKRGRVAEKAFRVVINEAVCEGCGDCAAVSNCLSLHPVDTELGRKTRIHQESCNVDESCLEGNCPSFATVVPNTSRSRDKHSGGPSWRSGSASAVPEPQRPEEANVLMVGIGGTGVVTVNQVLATAALLDGKHALGLDQTGLAQKGGPVVSNLKITREEIAEANRIGTADADAYLVFDLLAGAAEPNLLRASADRTVAVVSTGLIPTGAMVADVDADRPDAAAYRERIDSATRADDNVWLDAVGLAREVFKSQPAANTLVLGAAYQLGLLPVTADAIERAIELNGVAVEMNTEAFRLGRHVVADPHLADELLGSAGTSPEATSTQPELSPTARSLIDSVSADGELRRLLTVRVPELIAYQDDAYARQYADVMRRTRAREIACLGHESTRFSETVARELFKLMAYKDEYEVARLHLSPEFAASVERQFGPGAKVSFELQPPVLRRLGLDKKMTLPARVALPTFRALNEMRSVRGRWYDPFGWTDERRVERRLVTEYVAVVDELADRLTPDNLDEVVEVAALPDMIRGYDDVKAASIERYRAELATKLTELRS